MPHLRLEHSGNIQADLDDRSLFSQLHDILHEVGGIALGNCKGRRYVAEDFYVGNGDARGAFIHLDIRFMEGRSPSIKSDIGKQCNIVLRDAFAAALNNMDVQVTVEIRDILLSDYHKFPEGTLTPQ